MSTLALITVLAANPTATNAPVQGPATASQVVELTVAGPELPPAENTVAPTVQVPTPKVLKTDSTSTEVTPVLKTDASPSPLATPVDTTEATSTENTPVESTTPIDWDKGGTDAVLTTDSNTQKGSAGIPLAMLPILLGFGGLAYYFRKRVFTKIPGKTSDDPMNIIARKATGNQSAIFLIDVTDLEGGTRRLLVGSSPNGSNLLADVSPATSIFPEPVFEEENHQPLNGGAFTEADFRSNPSEDSPAPSLEVAESRQESTANHLDFGPKRALIDELIGGEKSSFRPQSPQRAYQTTNTNTQPPNSEEKRLAAQAVLDEVLAERRSGHRGTQVRVTA